MKQNKNHIASVALLIFGTLNLVLSALAANKGRFGMAFGCLGVGIVFIQSAYLMVYLDKKFNQLNKTLAEKCSSEPRE